jgi:hypothetical protein
MIIETKSSFVFSVMLKERPLTLCRVVVREGFPLEGPVRTLPAVRVHLLQSLTRRAPRTPLLLASRCRDNVKGLYPR